MKTCEEIKEAMMKASDVNIEDNTAIIILVVRGDKILFDSLGCKSDDAAKYMTAAAHVCTNGNTPTQGN